MKEVKETVILGTNQPTPPLMQCLRLLVALSVSDVKEIVTL